MFELEKIVKKVEEMDAKSYATSLAVVSARVVEKLANVMQDGLAGLVIYQGLILGAVMADGKVSEGEFLLIKPMLDIAFEADVSYEASKELAKYLRPEAKEYKQYIDAVTDLFGEIDEDLKVDIITSCLLICGIDGKISLKEKMWLKQLVK